MSVEARLHELGIVLPAPAQVPASVTIPFSWCRVHDTRVLLSGHGAQAPDGQPLGPFGQVPTEVPLELAQQSARLAGASLLGSLQRAIGDLERVRAWLVVNGFVNAQAGYQRTTAVINPVSDLLLEAFGPAVGAHARTAIGVSALPLNLPVIVSAEVEIQPEPS